MKNKNRLRIFAILDGVLLLILFVLMFWLNNSEAYGHEAMTNAAYFMVCYVLFQICLAVLAVLGVIRLVRYLRGRKAKKP